MQGSVLQLQLATFQSIDTKGNVTEGIFRPTLNSVTCKSYDLGGGGGGGLHEG